MEQRRDISKQDYDRLAMSLQSADFFITMAGSEHKLMLKADPEEDCDGVCRHRQAAKFLSQRSRRETARYRRLSKDILGVDPGENGGKHFGGMN